MRSALVFHRDLLNGGLAQATYNAHTSGEDFEPEFVVQAYREFGLDGFADLTSKADQLYKQLEASGSEDTEDADSKWETLDEHYLSMTYGPDEEGPDALESMLMEFIAQNPGKFANIVAIAERR